MTLGSASEVLIQTLGQPSPPSAAEVESLAEHDGMSVEQATHSLDVQHRAGDVGSELREVLGDSFAGVWYDRKAATFQIGIVDGKGEDAARQLVTSKRLRSQFVPVKYTYGQLAGVAARWTAAHPDLTARDEATHGAWICHSGITTNIQCGPVASPANQYGIVSVQTCSDYGDSGGPFINGNLAAGVLSFATNIACPNQYSYYQQQNTANSLMNVHLL